MKSGFKPLKYPHHKNYDYFKTFHAEEVKMGAITLPQFPQEYFTSDGTWMPDQNADGLPEGCTDYAQAGLAKDLGETNVSPQQLEGVTHANASGGYSIQASLEAARKVLKWFTYYFQIKQKANLDWFDAFRLAQSEGIPEKRSITLGTPWFPSWEDAAKAGIGIMPMPTPQELQAIQDNPNAYPWHNSELDGWSNTFFPNSNGNLIYRDKSWQGINVGYKGFVGFNRATINVVMGINGTCAFTASNMGSNNPVPIDLSIFQKFISYIKTWLGLAY